MREWCVVCGSVVHKPGILDPYVCRTCEIKMEEKTFNSWLDA